MTDAKSNLLSARTKRPGMQLIAAAVGGAGLLEFETQHWAHRASLAR